MKGCKNKQVYKVVVTASLTILVRKLEWDQWVGTVEHSTTEIAGLLCVFIQPSSVCHFTLFGCLAS